MPFGCAKGRRFLLRLPDQHNPVTTRRPGHIRRHHIVFEKTYGDAWAETITRLSDDDVVMDDVDRLLIALKRAGVISGREMVTLLVNYMRDNQ